MENSAIRWKILRLKCAAKQNECQSPVNAEDRKQIDEKKKRMGGLEVLNQGTVELGKFNGVLIFDSKMNTWDCYWIDGSTNLCLR